MKITSRKPVVPVIESNVRFYIKGIEIEPAPVYTAQMVSIQLSIPLLEIREILENSKTYDEIYHALEAMIKVVK